MASQPGPLTDWPWKKLGNLKYGLLLPWVAQSAYRVATRMRSEDETMELDMVNLSIVPTLLLRLIYSQAWISFSRFQTAGGRRTIVRKSLDYEQVDRENNWDDQILFTALLVYAVNAVLPAAAYLPWWDTKGLVILALVHAGPVEFLYYWLHRALHHHILYSRYHSHHHASVVTQPITSVIHPFAEELAYFILFATPLMTITLTGTGSIATLIGYQIYVDFMNYMGHCNFELIPKWVFSAFPPLKYFMYTPSFHSLHHTQFRTNYSLFMPLYDYIYGTADKSSDELYKSCAEGLELEAPDTVHLTHMTSLLSIYHTRLGFASVSSKPYSPKWFMWFLLPFTWTALLLAWLCGSTFTVEKNRMKKLIMETWIIPRYSFQYKLPSQREPINNLIEKAILNAEKKGAKVITLGLLNQGDELNGYGKIYIQKYPALKINVVDGTSLAAAVVLNSILKGTQKILITGKFSKMAYALVFALCKKNVKVMLIRREEYELVTEKLPVELQQHLVLTDSYEECKVWLIGEGLKDGEQRLASKDTHFIPFSVFPPKKLRNDCFYQLTPSLIVPKAYENQHTCENWLPRRMMSAWRVAGIVHALEGWGSHECDDATCLMDIEKAWLAAMNHGFLPAQSHNN